MTSGRSRAQAWDGPDAMKTASSGTTSFWPPTTKTSSTGIAGGFSGWPMSDASSTRNIPGVLSWRSQYGWLTGVAAGSVRVASRTDSRLGLSSTESRISRPYPG